jgi:hypothetical protein
MIAQARVRKNARERFLGTVRKRKRFYAGTIVERKRYVNFLLAATVVAVVSG